MGDSYSDPRSGRNFENSRNDSRSGFKGGRGQGNRDGGGFRIRLSENEMRSARSLQEAFNLRSTVAVLGFALRTLGEMLEQGKLEDLLNEYRSEGTSSDSRRSHNFRNNRNNDQNRNSFSNSPKPNPFERPSKPQEQINNTNQESPEDISKKSSENESEALNQDAISTEENKIDIPSD